MSQPQPVSLSLEQQFAIRAFETKVYEISSLDEARRELIELYRQSIIKEAEFKQQLKLVWGIE